jgi:hypothetical protein
MALRTEKVGYRLASSVENLHHVRILAFDVRLSRFGYALFDGPQTLLDWGASEIPAGLAYRAAVLIARKRVAPLMKLGHPTAVIIRRPCLGNRGSTASTFPIANAIIRESTSNQVRLHSMTRKEIQHAFRIFRGSTTDEIASILADIFPELLTRLPPKKKKWQSERHAMIVFDAIATGFAFWLRDGAPFPAPDGVAES